MSNDLTLEIDELNKPYWQAIRQGELSFQLCRSCGHGWLPAREACPACLSTVWQWKTATGKGKIVSWVVYHVAHHPAFADRLPYNVALIELEEGPRLLSNVLNEPARFQHGAEVRLVIDTNAEIPLAQFELV